MKWPLWLLIGILGLGALSFAFWKWNTRATLIQPQSELPEAFPSTGFSHASFEGLLSRYVHEGQIDYASWHESSADQDLLNRYLAAIAAFSPDNTPERFPSKEDRLAYWMYAYNAFVIRGVLDHWPLESVNEVKAPVELVRGLGFFYTLEFVAGGERFKLYDLEREKVIKEGQDPRIHFVLNCGSKGCPVMRPKLPTGEDLEPFLAAGAAQFVSEARNVRIDHQSKQVALSEIFEWYADEFIAAVRRAGRPTERGVVAYIVMVAPAPLAKELEEAAGYKVTFHDYDWSLNAAGPAAAPETTTP